MYVNINNLCCLSFYIDYTPFAYEEFPPTFTHQVQKESVIVASTSASIVSSMIASTSESIASTSASIASTSASIISSMITTPTSNTNLASGTVSSWRY